MQADPKHTPPNQQDRRKPLTGPRMRKQPNGLHVFCYDAGGLGGGLYEELLHFLDESHYIIALIEESRWGHDAEYTTP